MAEAAPTLPERVLVVDDEETIQFVLSTLLREQGYVVDTVGTAEAAFAKLEGHPYDLALLDIILPGVSGLELLDRIRQRCTDTQVVMMTSHASAQTAIEALRKGAYDYIHKPFELDEVLAVVERALEKRALTLQNRRLAEEQAQQNLELRLAVRRLRSLNAAGIGMSGISSLSELLDFFVGLVEDEFDAERVSLMLVHETGDELRIAAARGLGDEVVRDTRVRVGEGVAGLVAREGRALVASEDGRTEAARLGGWPGASGGFVSMPVSLSVPIRTSQDVLGVLNVSNRRDGAPFSRDDVAYLSSLAGQAAVAIERARQSDRLVSAYQSLRATQDQVVSTGRLKALGEMAAGIAHDFNNVLNGILGRSQLIQRELRSDSARVDRLISWAELIEKLSLQGAETVRRIQEFSRIRRDRPAHAVELKNVANLAVGLTEPKWREEARSRGVDVQIEAELRDTPPIAGNLQELSQAVSNLIFNSVEAMPRGGRVTLRTYVRDHRAVIEVEDDGTGMTPETRDRMFEPFFTTKDSGQGLGMSVVYGIVTRFGGEVTVFSEPNRGTRVTLAFPALAESHAEPPPAPVATSHVTGRVLVIDDEEQNREICREFLATAGHEVDTAASGAEALALLAGQGYDVVITDLSMPGLSGWDVARDVKRNSPDTRVMLLSGWGIQQDEANVQDAGVDLVMSKPVEMDVLLGSVQQLLAA